MLGYQRNFTQKDILLDRVLVLASALDLLENAQAQPGFERCLVGQVPFAAFVDRIFFLEYAIFAEFQQEIALDVFDREYGLEDFLQPFFLPALGMDVFL